MKNFSRSVIIIAVMDIFVPDWLEKFAEVNESPIYIVGGYVRNILGGLPPSDIDIAGRPLPDGLKLPRGWFFATTYRRMGTALIKCRYRSDIELEYTPFRTEKYAPGGGHVPVSVSFDADLMRAVDPERVFSSDGLRLMRLVRIAAETGFGIERATADEAMKRAPLLADITPNRKRDELLKILMADTVYGVEDAHYRGLKLLREYGFLQYVIPELAELGTIAQPSEHHKYDALEHTFRVVRVCPPELRLAALMHDIGKTEAVRRTGRMVNHDVYGEEMTRRILGEMKFPVKTADRVARLVRWHMYDKDAKTRSGKMLVFTARNADIIDDLETLIRADRAGRGTDEPAPPVRFSEFRKKLTETGAPLSIGKLKINGADLMTLGYEGADVRAKLEELFDMCVLTPELNKHKKLMKLARREEEGQNDAKNK